MADAVTNPTGSSHRFGFSVAIGLMLTSATMVLLAFGGLEFFERPLLDLRHRLFARTTAAPSPKIVHIDIDDTSLQRNGRWPWTRTRLAQVVDELHRAGAAVIGFDLLLDDPQPPEYQPDPDDPTGHTFRRIDHDANFADAIRRAGNVVLPVNIDYKSPYSPTVRRVIEALGANVHLAIDELTTSLALNKTQARQIGEILPSLRAVAIRNRLRQCFAENHALDFDTCRHTILGDGPDAASGPTFQMFEQEYARFHAIQVISRNLPPSAANDLYDPAKYRPTITVPIFRLAEQSHGTGFVTYETDPDGVLRSIPLILQYENRIYPHFALALACQYLHVPIDRLVVSNDALTIPDATFPGGQKLTVRLPLLQPRLSDDWRYRHHRLLVTWPTNADRWQMLFSRDGQNPRQHFPIGPLVETADLVADVRHDEIKADDALLGLLNDPALARAFNAQLARQYDRILSRIRQSVGQPDPALIETRNACRQQFIETIEHLVDIPPGETLDPADQKIVDHLNAALQNHRRALEAADLGRRRIGEMRARLRSLCDNAICLIGWTATGALADFLPTSLEDKCPGVVVHGAVINAILTRHFLRRAPLAVDLAITLLIGLIATLFATRFPPVSALLMVAGLIATWFLVNGITLFDYGDRWVDVAGPTTAAATTWMGVTVWRLLTEQRQRLRITRQFKNYVSHDLVDFLVENPHLIKMEGESRELTCMFTDIAGFTTISRQLGPEATARLLNRYLGIATEQLMTHNATVNKYLGDGIMAFWGAPVRNPNHALDSCLSVLSCLEALKQLDDDPMLRGMPRLFLRVGLATGTVMVGDFGAPPHRSDYTVIGDTVNLASRLESANKQFGTQVLMSDQTHERVQTHILARPVGRIVVVGRDEGEPVWQMLATRDAATADQIKLAEQTTDAVHAFYQGDFDRCEKLFDELAECFGPSKLIDRYFAACARWKSSRNLDEFNGALILTEK